MGKEAFSSDDGMLKLVGLLLSGQTLTAKRIESELGIRRAAARRKLQSLQELPGASSARVARDPGVRLPTLLGLPAVTPTDVAAACLASSFGSALQETVLGKHLRKLVDELVLRSKDHRDAKELDRKFWFVVRGGERALPRKTAMLGQVVDAILDSKAIRFDYRHFNGDRGTVSAQPLTLAVHDHQFYIVSRRDGDSGVYPFRFARMSNVRVGTAFSYPTESEYDPIVVFRDCFGIFLSLKEQPVDVRLRVNGGWSNYIESHRWHASQEVIKNPDGSLDLRIHVRICPEVKRWIMWFGSEAEVLEPAWLRNDIARDLRKAAACYRAVKPGLASGARRKPAVARARPAKSGSR